MKLKYLFVTSFAIGFIAPAIASAQINVLVTPSRPSCVAPCGVVFDATASTGLANNDYVEAQFSWDFGDPSSGNWSFGRRNPDGTYPSRNQTTGFIAAHVFDPVFAAGENQKTFTVNVHVKDTAGNEDDALPVSVTVQNPDVAFASNTVCIARDGNNWTGCPSTARIVNSGNLITEIGNQMSAGKRRILLRRGDEWIGSNGFSPNFTGPVVIAAFGSGAKPRLVFSNPNPETYWRINSPQLSLVDLELKGPYSWGQDGPGYQVGIWVGGGAFGASGDNFLALRLDVHHFYSGVYGGYRNDKQFIVDSDIHHNYTNSYGAGSTSRLAVLGNWLHDEWQTHNVYTYYRDKLIFANNLLEKPGFNTASQPRPSDFAHPDQGQPMPAGKRFYSNRLNLRIAAGSGEEDPGEYPTIGNAILVDNVSKDGLIGFAANISGEADDDDYAHSHVLFERNTAINHNNWFGMNCFLFVHVKNGVARNNQCLSLRSGTNTGGGDVDVAFQIDDYRNAGSYHSNDTRIYNNSFYLNKDAIGIIIDDPLIRNVRVMNNVFYNPEGQEIYSLPAQFPLTALTSNYNDFYSPNLSGPTSGVTWATWRSTYGKDQQSLFSNPQFVDVASERLGLSNSSPVINMGAAIPVYHDFDRRLRPANSNWDIGAFEYGAQGGGSSSSASSSSSSSSSSSVSSSSSNSSSSTSSTSSSSSSSSVSSSSSSVSSSSSSDSSASSSSVGDLDVDSDGDGIPDVAEECPNDPAKIEAGICGCGLPELDVNGDFVIDCGFPRQLSELLSPAFGLVGTMPRTIQLILEKFEGRRVTYHVELRGPQPQNKLKKKSTSSNFLAIRRLKPGAYTVHFYVKYRDGRRKKRTLFSETITVAVPNVPPR